MRLTKTQRSELRGKFGGKCSYCGCELPESGWHADHAEPVIRVTQYEYLGDGKGRFVPTGEMRNVDNDNVDNLMPACAPCNIYKSSMNVDGLRWELERQVERARKSSTNFRLAERFGLVTVNETPIVFHFERFTALPPKITGGE